MDLELEIIQFHIVEGSSRGLFARSYFRMGKLGRVSKNGQDCSEIAVVNDTGKRGVKDIEDYANKAQDGDKRPIMVLISNLHRSIIPDF